MLDHLTIEPSGASAGTVIWLHGLGASGDDFVPVVPHLGCPQLRFVFPHAPVRPVTINAGMQMRAWYDILHLAHGPGRNHPDHIWESVALVEELIAAEAERGVPAEKIVVAGFSQGGAVALHTVVRHGDRLAGGLVLSAYELLPSTRPGEATEANRSTPLFFGHGTLDPTVPVDRGLEAAERARAAGHPVEVHTYRMGHEVCLPELQAIGQWLRGRFAAS